LAKDLAVNPNPDAATINKMKAELSRETVTEVDPARKTIANALGLSLKQQLQNLHDEVHQLRENQNRDQEELRELRENQSRDQEELRELRENQSRDQEELSGSDFLIVRASTMDDWAEDRDPDSEDGRNALVHGGKLPSDVKTIRLFASLEPERVARWKAVFKRFYGMPFERIDPVINTLPDVLVDVMNKRASVHWLKKWRRPSNRDRQSTIISIANDFIRCFCEKGATGVTDQSMAAKLEILKEAWLIGMTQMR